MNANSLVDYFGHLNYFLGQIDKTSVMNLDFYFIRITLTKNAGDRKETPNRNQKVEYYLE